MRVITSNVHADVDGWGRRTTAVSETLAHAPDILFMQELWRGDEDDVARVAQAVGGDHAYVPLAECWRVTGNSGGSGWEPLHGLLTGDRGLFFPQRRPLDASRARQRDASIGAQWGEWGVGLFARGGLDDVRRHDLIDRPRDKVNRRLITASTQIDGRDVILVALHGAHLSHGSLIQYREIRRIADEVAKGRPVIMAGDFNSWRPPLRTSLGSWRDAVRGKTWPAWMAHSQIDHILYRGPFRIETPLVQRTGSDHRALVCEMSFR